MADGRYSDRSVPSQKGSKDGANHGHGSGTVKGNRDSRPSKWDKHKGTVVKNGNRYWDGK